jgi:hypothetical protein
MTVAIRPMHCCRAAMVGMMQLQKHAPVGSVQWKNNQPRHSVYSPSAIHIPVKAVQTTHVVRRTAEFQTTHMFGALQNYTTQLRILAQAVCVQWKAIQHSVPGHHATRMSAKVVRLTHVVQLTAAFQPTHTCRASANSTVQLLIHAPVPRVQW